MEAAPGTVLPTVWVSGRRTAEGLVPGVEWLSAGEPSSNPRGFGPDFHDRSRPPMEHLCAPYLAVSVGTSAKAVPHSYAPSWCPDSVLGGFQGRPDPREAVTVGVWWTPGPFVRPRVEIPSRSSPVDATCLGVEGVRSATLCLVGGLTAAVTRNWLDDTGGLPEPIVPPRNDRDSLRLCRAAWDRMRDGRTGRWRIVVEGSPEPAPAIAALGLWDALWTGNDLENARSDASAIAPGQRADRNGAHVLRWELPFLIGGVVDAMAAVDREVAGLRKSQRADGGWDFGAKAGPNARLGCPGDRLSGTGSHATWMVLRHARITGNPESIAAGRRA
ncbi:MAG: hypothetical protein ACOVT5_17910, partial [Armatimonadaceae bacterium]